MLYTPRDYQDGASTKTVTYLQEESGSPLVAMPTGTGKSIVIADTMLKILRRWPGSRLLCATHVKGLVQQNADKLAAMWPGAPYGINSAGLKRRDTAHPIIFGGIKSMLPHIDQLGKRDIVFVDEAHLISPNDETEYFRFLSGLRKINPHMRLVGYSATCWRLGQGLLTEGGMFTDIAVNQTTMEWFNWFIKSGYLARLVPKPCTNNQIDMRGVKITNGDFNEKDAQKAAAEDGYRKTYNCLLDAMHYAQDRRAWICFTSGVEHAEAAAAFLRSFGVKAQALHSKTKGPRTDGLRGTIADQYMEEYLAGKLQCLVTNNMLTTGFDYPPVDLIIMLRATTSSGLWVQMLGRGTRPSLSTGKQDCLVLDYAGNTRRCGPINDPIIPKAKGKGGGGEAPVRICEVCDTFNHASARYCEFCGNEFERQENLVQHASTDELIRDDTPHHEWYDVTQVRYFAHNSRAGNKCLRVVYDCGMRSFEEYVMIGAITGGPAKRARDWWRLRFPGDFLPANVSEALSHITELAVPSKVEVWINKPEPEIVGYA